jgi:hypothetical protein
MAHGAWRMGHGAWGRLTAMPCMRDAMHDAMMPRLVLGSSGVALAQHGK